MNKNRMLSALMVLSMLISSTPVQAKTKSLPDVKLGAKTVSVVKGNTEKVKIQKAKKVKVSSVKVSGYKKKIVKVSKSKSFIKVKGKKIGTSPIKVTIKYKKNKKNYKKTIKLKVNVVENSSNTDSGKTTEITVPVEPKPDNTNTKKDTTSTESKTEPTKQDEKTTTEPKKDDVVITEPTTDEHTHVLVKVDAKEPTCMEDGNLEYYECTDCGKYYKDKKATTELSEEELVVKSNGHVEGEPITEIEQPTCTEPGQEVITVKCKYCGIILSRETKSIEATGHKWGEYSITKEPTIDEEGEEVRVCLNNNEHKETRKIPKINHTHELVEVKAKNATCTEAGNISHWVCSDCGRYFSDNEGKNQLTEEQVIVKPLGHKNGTPIKTDIIEATCTKEGSYTETIKCTECGAVVSQKTVRIEPLGHTAGEPTVENKVEPTCTVKGSYDEVIKCKSCLEEISRTKKEVPAKGHTAKEPIKENEVAATCTTGGSWDEVVYCKDCGAETNRTHKTSDALGHDLVHLYNYGDDAKNYHRCQRSGCNFKEACEFDTNVIKEPTCQKGVTEHTCKICGYKYSEYPKAIKEHTYSDVWKASGKGIAGLSYTHNEYAYHYCTECGNQSKEYKRMPFAESPSSTRHVLIEGRDSYLNLSLLCNYVVAFPHNGFFQSYIMTFQDVSGKLYAMEVTHYDVEEESIGIRIYDADNTDKYLTEKTYNGATKLETINNISTYCKNNSTEQNYFDYNFGWDTTWQKYRQEFGTQFLEALNDRDWFSYDGSLYVSYQMFCAFAVDMGYQPTSFCYGWECNNYRCGSVYVVD